MSPIMSMGRRYSSAAAPFSPGNLSGLKFWVKSDAGVSTSGANVTGWADQSGGGNNLTPKGSASLPIFSATGWNGDTPAILTTNGNYLGFDTFNFQTSFFSIALAVYHTGANNAFFRYWSHRALAFQDDFDNAGWCLFSPTGDGTDMAFVSTTQSPASPPTTITPAVPQVLMCVGDGATVSTYVNNVLNVTGVAFSSVVGDTSNFITIGSDYTRGTQQGQNQYGEVILCNTAWSPTDRSNIYTYLKSRFTGLP
jgi:hypothetical protein